MTAQITDLDVGSLAPDFRLSASNGREVGLIIQRTASVVVDREGTIQYLKQTFNSMTWLQESQELLKVVQNLSRTEKPAIS